jgi:hypothetical protein
VQFICAKQSHSQALYKPDQHFAVNTGSCLCF